MKPEIEAKAQVLLDNTYKYKSRTFTVTGWHTDKIGNVVVETLDGNDISVHPSRLEDAVMEFEKVNKEDSLAIQDQTASFKKIVMENISKLKTDSSFIPQAEAINSTMNTFINMLKLQVEMEKLKLKSKEL